MRLELYWSGVRITYPHRFPDISLWLVPELVYMHCQWLPSGCWTFVGRDLACDGVPGCFE